MKGVLTTCLILLCAYLIFFVIFILFIYISSKEELKYKRIIKKKQTTLYEKIYKLSYQKQLHHQIKEKLLLVLNLDSKIEKDPILTYKCLAYYVKIIIKKRNIIFKLEYLVKDLKLNDYKYRYKNLKNSSSLDEFYQYLIKLINNINLDIKISGMNNKTYPFDERTIKKNVRFINFIKALFLMFVIVDFILIISIIFISIRMIFEYKYLNNEVLSIYIFVILFLTLLIIFTTKYGFEYLKIILHYKKDIIFNRSFLVKEKPIKIEFIFESVYRSYGLKYLRCIIFVYQNYKLYLPIIENNLICRPKNKKECIKLMMEQKVNFTCLEKSKIVILGKEQYLTLAKKILVIDERKK